MDHVLQAKAHNGCVFIKILIYCMYDWFDVTICGYDVTVCDGNDSFLYFID